MNYFLKFLWLVCVVLTVGPALFVGALLYGTAMALTFMLVVMPLGAAALVLEAVGYEREGEVLVEASFVLIKVLERFSPEGGQW